MLKKILTLPIFAACMLGDISVGRAETVSQDFTANPLTNGWTIFGDATLFTWDATNQNLRVTWDSSHTNSYFHHPLGTTVTRHDDFQIEFDLTMTDCISGHEPGKTGPLQIGIGLFNLAGATSAGFGRGTYGGAPDLAEFNYFPYGYYTFGQDIYPSDATTVVDFISSSGYGYTPTFFDPIYEFQLPTNQLMRVEIKYTAQNQTLVLKVKTNGVVIYQPPNIVLNDPSNSGFSSSDNFQVDTFSISSYSSFNDPFNSVLGHGTLDNILVYIPPVQDLKGALSSNMWEAQFRSRSNWLYTLERTVNFSAWTNASVTLPGTGGTLSLQDTNPPGPNAFYRVRASQP